MIVELLFAGSAFYSASSAKASKENKKLAKKIRGESYERISKMQLEVEEQAKNTDLQMEKLANRRNAVYTKSFDEFIKVVDVLQLVDDSNESKAIANDIRISFEEFASVKSSFSINKMHISNTEAMSSFLLFGIAGYMKKKSELELSNSRIARKNAEAIEAQSKNIIDFMKYVGRNCDLMSNVTVKLNILFLRCLKTLEPVIEQKGERKSTYTREERELIKLCFNLVDALKKVCTCSLMEDDDISKKFIEAISLGEEHLMQINALIDSKNYNLM